MRGADPTANQRRGYERESTPNRSDVPVAGLLRDAIVGITCFPDPLRDGQRKSRRWRRWAVRD